MCVYVRVRTCACVWAHVLNYMHVVCVLCTRAYMLVYLYYRMAFVVYFYVAVS